MRRYETIFIVDPDVSEEQRGAINTRLEDFMSKSGGVLLMRDDWGVKKLAYEIRNRSRGHYIRLDYCGNGPMVDEIERSFRIDDKVLKYMTIVLAKDVDPTKAKEEMLKAAEEKKVVAETLSDDSSAAADENVTYEIDEEEKEA
jgi:small subunit ribosomal protein S6